MTATATTRPVLSALAHVVLTAGAAMLGARLAQRPEDAALIVGVIFGGVALASVALGAGLVVCFPRLSAAQAFVVNMAALLALGAAVAGVQGVAVVATYLVFALASAVVLPTVCLIAVLLIATPIVALWNILSGKAAAEKAARAQAEREGEEMAGELLAAVRERLDGWYVAVGAWHAADVKAKPEAAQEIARADRALAAAWDHLRDERLRIDREFDAAAEAEESVPPSPAYLKLNAAWTALRHGDAAIAEAPQPSEHVAARAAWVAHERAVREQASRPIGSKTPPAGLA